MWEGVRAWTSCNKSEVSIFDQLGVPVNSLSESPLWSPSSNSSSGSSSDTWSTGRYFSFKDEFDMIPNEVVDSPLQSQEFWESSLDFPGIGKKSNNIIIDDEVDLRESVANFMHSWNENNLSEENELFSDSPLESSGVSSPHGSVSSEDQPWSPNSRRLFISSIDDDHHNINNQDLRCMWIDCKATFDHQGSMVRHIDRNHVEGRKEDFRCFWLGCPRKSRPFNARYKLLIHMRVHTGHKPNRCNIPGCDKAFSRLENLKIHVRSHTGERPYVCARCPKAFSNSSDRAKHQRTHIESKPYRCIYPNCDKKYTDPSSLRKHAKIHFLPNSSIFNKQHCFTNKKSPSSRSRSRIISDQKIPFLLQSIKSEKSSEPLPKFESIQPHSHDDFIQNIEIDKEGSTINLDLNDTGFSSFILESKCDVTDDTLLSDIDWISCGELKDIDQILGF